MLKIIFLILISFVPLQAITITPVNCPIRIYLDYDNGPNWPGMENAKITVSNVTKDSVLIITGFQLYHQLTNADYFYHGIYGEIKKENGAYFHNPMKQQLSIPLATTVLLSNQTIIWGKKVRIGKKIRAILKWKAFSFSKAQEIAFYDDQSRKSKDIIIPYVPLSNQNEINFRILSELNGAPPLCIIENYDSLKENIDTISVGLIKENYGPFFKDNAFIKRILRDINANPNSMLTQDIICKNPAVYLNDTQAVLLEFNEKTKKYEKWLALPATSVDFISCCLNFCEDTADCYVPSILDDTLFSDIVKVNKPRRQMYFDPGITKLKEADLKKCLQRVKEKKLRIEVKVCDPNGLGAGHILKMGK